MDDQYLIYYLREPMFYVDMDIRNKVINRIEELGRERDVSNELGKAFEEDAGQLRAKLTKAVEALQAADQYIMENVPDSLFVGPGEDAVGAIRVALAELEKM